MAALPAHAHRPVMAMLMALALLGTAGCTPKLDTERHDAPRATLGAEMYRVLCERIAKEESPTDVTGAAFKDLCRGNAPPESATTPRLRALADRRDKLVRAFDLVLPASLEDDLEGALLQMLPLYDPPSDRMPRWANATAEALAALANDPKAIETLGHLSSREGYRPLSHALGVLRPILNYDHFDDFASETLHTILDKPETSAAFWDLVRASAVAMASATPSTEPPGEATFDVAKDLLLGESSTLYVASQNLMVRRDPRGLAQVAPRGGTLPAPFVDADGDTLADVDAEGRFTDHGTTPLAVPTPFAAGLENNVPRDLDGRALGADGLPLYSYFDANKTLLAGLMYDSRLLTTPEAPALLDLTAGVPVLLGPSTSLVTIQGAAQWVSPNFNTGNSPLLSVVHAAGAVLADPQSDEVLSVLDELLTDHEDAVARLIDSGLRIDTEADKSTAKLAQPNTFWDDILRATSWMAAEPGLTEAVLRALADPRTRRMGPIIADFMRKRDYVEPYSFDPNGSLADAQFTTPVDRNAASGRGNQSLFQRVASLIHDMDQAQVCNKEDAQVGVSVPLVGFSTLPPHFARCSLVEIDNMAQLFSQSVIGRAHIPVKTAWVNVLTGAASAIGIGYLSVDELFQRESGITGLDTSPTPEALARMQFMPQNKFLKNIFGTTLTRDGIPVSPRHDGTIFACEKKYHFADGKYPTSASFYDVISPFLVAFDDYDRGLIGDHIGAGADSPRFIFGEFIAAMHSHWGAPGDDTTQDANPNAPSYAHHDDIVSYEPLIAYAMDDAKFVERLHELALALEAIQVAPGRDGISVLASSVESLMRPIDEVGITKRNLTTTTVTNDGKTTVRATRLHLILDALREMDAAFATDQSTHQRWLRGRGALVDQWLTPDPQTGGATFRNRRALNTIKVLLHFLQDRVAVHKNQGNLQSWGTGLDTRLEASIQKPVVAAALHFIDTLGRDPQATNALAGLLTHLTSTDTSVDDFNSTVLASVDLFQFLDDEETLVPLLHALSRLAAPNAQEVFAQGGTLDVTGSAVGNTIELLADVQKVDEQNAVLAILRNAVAIDPMTEETPLETILDALVEVNRATPGLTTPLTKDDYDVVLHRSEAFFGSDEHGLKRIVDVIRSRK